MPEPGVPRAKSTSRVSPLLVSQPFSSGNPGGLPLCNRLSTTSQSSGWMEAKTGIELSDRFAIVF